MGGTTTEYKCKRCDEHLERIPWNTAGNLLVCTNGMCEQFQRPAGWIHNGEDNHNIPWPSGHGGGVVSW